MVLPHRRLLLPAVGPAGQYELQRLRDAGLPRAVTPGDHGQARCWLELQSDLRADPAEALDDDALEEGATGRDSLGCGVRRPRRDRRAAACQALVECLIPF